MAMELGRGLGGLPVNALPINVQRHKSNNYINVIIITFKLLISGRIIVQRTHRDLGGRGGG